MESATGRVGEVEPSLFARKATGLVRGWAVRDAFVYAFFSINLVTLGDYNLVGASIIAWLGIAIVSVIAVLGLFAAGNIAVTALGLAAVFAAGLLEVATARIAR